MHPVVGLLLAAGSSRRFGSDKLLHHLPDGQVMVTASARRLAAVCDRTVVLVRPRQPAVREALRGLAVNIVEVEHASDGMGTTLATGVRAAPAAGWLVALADMPFIADHTLRAVATALRGGAAIAAPCHQGRRGHPVGFARQWHDTLATLSGDEGARRLLRAHDASITRIEVDDPGCLRDVDTPEDAGGNPRTPGR